MAEVLFEDFFLVKDVDFHKEVVGKIFDKGEHPVPATPACLPAVPACSMMEDGRGVVT